MLMRGTARVTIQDIDWIFLADIVVSNRNQIIAHRMKTEIDLRDDAAELRLAAPVVSEALGAGSAAPPTQRLVAEPGVIRGPGHVVRRAHHARGGIDSRHDVLGSVGPRARRV